MEYQSTSTSIQSDVYPYSDKANQSRRSVDWRDSGIVIDEDNHFSSFDVLCSDFTSPYSNIECTKSSKDQPFYGQDDDGDTILHLGVVGYSVDKVKDLIKLCDINSINNMFQTPMHVATIANRPEMVELLFEVGAKYDIHDRRGNTPLHIACQKGNLEIVHSLLRLIKSHQPTVSGPEVMRYIEMTNFEGQTSLHLAASHNHRHVVELLVDKFDANINCRDSRSGGTILHKAITDFNTDLVVLIMKLRKHCNGADFNGRVPLDTIRILRESRLDCNQLNKLTVIEQLVTDRIKTCADQNGCCVSSPDDIHNQLRDALLDSSSSSSDYTDSDSDMN